MSEIGHYMEAVSRKAENRAQADLLHRAERFVEDVREWASVAATRPDHPLLTLLAEYDAARGTGGTSEPLTPVPPPA